MPADRETRAWALAMAGVATLAAATLSGCVVGPNYRGPPLVAPKAVSAPAFHRAEDASAGPPPAKWWLALGDAELDTLIDDAFVASPDVEVAVARLRQSRAVVSKDRANLLPTTGAAAATLQTHGLTNVIGGGLSGGAAAAAQSQAASTSGNDGNFDIYSLALDASWQLDLFGGRRRALEGDKARSQAVLANLEDAEVSLAAEVAQDYVTLRGLQQRLALAEQNIDLESRMLTLTQVRRQGGDATDLDVERMVNQLRSTQAETAPLRGQVADQLDRLAILTGKAPGDLDAELSATGPVPAPPKVVVVGDPASLLRRRPDVRAAERTIQQKNALIGQRTADFFPKVTLLGEVGYNATDISSLFTHNAFNYVGAPMLQWSPFDFGRIRAGIREARGEEAEALGDYRKTVLGALADAETALATYGRQRENLSALVEVESSADRAARLTGLKVEGGTATSLDQIAAERDRVSAENNVAYGTAQLTLDYIRLEKSLGLGWAEPTQR
jgi:NodT family efflux transporter outer membrane factor (OMF) lipoprotein